MSTFIEHIYHDIRSQNIMAWKIMLNIPYMKFIPASGLHPSFVNNISILKVFKVYHCLNIITWIINDSSNDIQTMINFKNFQNAYVI